MNLIQFGLVPNSGKDMTKAFASLLEYCKNNSVKNVYLEQGVYDFYPDDALRLDIQNESEECVSKLFAVVLADLNEFYLDGRGSTFNIHGNITAFLVNSCNKVILNNFSIVYLSARAVLRVVEADKKFAVLHHEFPCEITGKQFFLIDDIGNKWQPALGTTPMLEKTNAKLIPNPFAKVRSIIPFGNDYVKLRTKKKMQLSPDAHLLAAPEKKWVWAMAFYDSSDISVSNIRIPSAPQGGIYAEGVSRLSFNYIQLGDGNFGVAGRALDCVSCLQQISIKNCVISGVAGDAISIRNEYFNVENAVGSIITVSCGGKGNLFPIKCGMIIDVYDGKTQTKLATATASSIKEIGNGSVEIITKNVVSVRAGDKITIGDSPKSEISQNTVDRAGGAGIIVTAARELLVENNVLIGTARAGIALTGDETNGGNIGSAVIRENVLKNISPPHIYVKPFGKKKGVAFCKRLLIEGNSMDSKKSVKQVVNRVGELNMAPKKN